MTWDPDPNSAPPVGREAAGAAKLVYVLYLVGFALPVCAVAGVILAYVKREEAGPVEATHLQYLIRSFWIGLGAIVLGSVLAIVFIGWAVLAVWTIWALARFITGALKLWDGLPVRDPETWGFTA